MFFFQNQGSNFNFIVEKPIKALFFSPYLLLHIIVMDSNFVDYVKIYCRSGKGGRGSMHWTLLHLKYQRHIYAEHGGNGGRDKCHGTNGKDTYIDVPCGTVVYNADTGKYVCDVTYDGQEVLLLKGGRGGLGNFQFRSATNDGHSGVKTPCRCWPCRLS